MHNYELLSLGEFGHFVSCLNFPCRQAISSKLGIRASDDSNALLPQRLIYVIKDLRNAIAHNDVVFDTRFRTNKIDRQVCNAISNATNVPNLNFETITDYLVLIVYLHFFIAVCPRLTGCRKIVELCLTALYVYSPKEGGKRVIFGWAGTAPTQCARMV